MSNTAEHNRRSATLAEIQARDGARAFRGAEVGAIDENARTVQLAFSSEIEVERWFGFEVLSHDPGAVVLSRLNDGAALLLEHDRDKQIGVVERVSIDADRRGRCVVRFGRSARAEEIFQDIVDGIRRHVSVGYRIHEAKLIEKRDDGDVWRVEKWEPFEISVVSVPADVSVGVGRSMEADQLGERAEKREAPEPMKEDIMPATTEAVTKPTETAPDAAQDAARRAAEAERARSRAIIEMGEAYGAPELARDAVKDGSSAEAFQRQLLAHLNSRMQQPLSEQMRAADIGLTEKEVRQFSFMKVIRALADPTSHAARREAAFEFEASEAAAAKRGKSGERFAVPTDVLTRALNTATTASGQGDTGGFLVANPLLASSFIEILRNRSTIMQLGNVLGGLVGNPDIPKQTAGAQGYWVGEDQDAGQGNQTLGQIGLTPKTCAAFSEITRRLMMQSSIDVEALVRADLAAALALTIDKAGYYGTGESNQPKGIVKHTGVNAVSFKTEGAPTFAELVQMETEIAVDNADVSSMAYVANAKMRGYAKTALKHEGIAGTLWEPGGTINGYRTEITNQIEDGHVFMGNFSDLIIGMWGGLDLTVDPYSGSKSGRLRVVVFQDVDFALRRTESFCVGKHG